MPCLKCSREVEQRRVPKDKDGPALDFKLISLTLSQPIISSRPFSRYLVKFPCSELYVGSHLGRRHVEATTVSHWRSIVYFRFDFFEKCEGNTRIGV